MSDAPRTPPDTETTLRLMRLFAATPREELGTVMSEAVAAIVATALRCYVAGHAEGTLAEQPTTMLGRLLAEAVAAEIGTDA